jgi:hypothetical protein
MKWTWLQEAQGPNLGRWKTPRTHVSLADVGTLHGRPRRRFEARIKIEVGSRWWSCSCNHSWWSFIVNLISSDHVPSRWLFSLGFASSPIYTWWSCSWDRYEAIEYLTCSLDMCSILCWILSIWEALGWKFCIFGLIHALPTRGRSLSLKWLAGRI